MNRTTLLGNLAADPELRYTQSGQPVMSFRLCTSETYLDKNKVKQEIVEWHQLTLWGKRAESLAKFLIKGTRILVVGRLHYSSYDDKDGIKRYKTEIIVNEVEFAGGKRADGNQGGGGGSSGGGGSGGGNSNNNRSNRTDDVPPDDFGGGDDIPF